MFLDLHIIQSHAPSNLNRDDTGAPKDCMFGDARRARISSQCIKRAIRTAMHEDPLLGDLPTAERTRRLREEVAGALVARGRDAQAAHDATTNALELLGFGFDKKTEQSEYLLFLGRDEIERLVAKIDDHWDALVTDGGGPGGKKRKRGEAPKELTTAFAAVLGGSRALDLALFGRMLADRPASNVDAASQVAHAISTHRTVVEVDFFTAVDDRSPQDESGAGMMGTIEFNAACYYRYANLNLTQLTGNLGGDGDLAAAAIGGFLRAAIHATPTGKQNGFAAQNPPSFVMVDLRAGAPWSLANAFLRPVRSAPDSDLASASIEALADHYRRLTTLYEAESRATYALLGGIAPPALLGIAEHVASIPALIASVEAAAS